MNNEVIKQASEWIVYQIWALMIEIYINEKNFPLSIDDLNQLKINLINYFNNSQQLVTTKIDWEKFNIASFKNIFYTITINETYSTVKFKKDSENKIIECNSIPKLPLKSKKLIYQSTFPQKNTIKVF